MARITMSKPVDNGGGNWSPLPQGTYDVQISECTEEGVSANNFPKIKVSGEIVGGPYAGKKTSQFFTLSDKSTWRMTNLLDAAGVQYDEESDGLVAFDTDDLLGVYVTILVTMREYQGKEYNDWKTFKPCKLSQGTSDTMTQAPAQTLPATQAVARQQRQAAPAQTAQVQQAVVAQAAAPAVARRARA